MLPLPSASLASSSGVRGAGGWKSLRGASTVGISATGVYGTVVFLPCPGLRECNAAACFPKGGLPYVGESNCARIVSSIETSQ